MHPEGLHVLVSPVSIDFEQPSSLEPRNLPRMLHTASQLYPWVLVDLPRSQVEATKRMVLEHHPEAEFGVGKPGR